MTFANSGLTNRPANEITFQREGQTISVVQHFQQTYQMNLRFGRLPCVIQKAGPKESFYPMELVKIVYVLFLCEFWGVFGIDRDF